MLQPCAKDARFRSDLGKTGCFNQERCTRQAAGARARRALRSARMAEPCQRRGWGLGVSPGAAPRGADVGAGGGSRRDCGLWLDKNHSLPLRRPRPRERAQWMCPAQLQLAAKQQLLRVLWAPTAANSGVALLPLRRRKEDRGPYQAPRVRCCFDSCVVEHGNTHAPHSLTFQAAGGSAPSQPSPFVNYCQLVASWERSAARGNVGGTTYATGRRGAPDSGSLVCRPANSTCDHFLVSNRCTRTVQYVIQIEIHRLTSGHSLGHSLMGDGDRHLQPPA